MINRIIKYFDLQSRRRSLTIGVAGQERLSVFPQYIAASLGVIAEPYLSAYANTGSFSFDTEGFVSRIIFGLIIGLVILPAVYRAAFDDEKPRLVQFATLFVSGLGWQSLFAAALKAGEGVA